MSVVLFKAIAVGAESTLKTPALGITSGAPVKLFQ